MQPWSAEIRGRFDEQRISSRALEGNPLEDPSERPLWVYLPPSVDERSGQRYLSIYVKIGRAHV